MKFHIDKKYFYWGMTAFLVFAASICLYYLLFHGANVSGGFHTVVRIAMPILDGFLLAYLLTPILNTVEKKMLIPLCHKYRIELTKKTSKRIRMLSILITVVLVTAVLYGFFAMVIPQLIRSIQSIVFQFPIYINNLSLWSTRLLADNPKFEAIVMDLLNQYSGELTNYLNHNLIPQMNELLKNLSLSFLSFLMQLWNLIIGFVISIYILSSKELFAGQAKKIAYALFETKEANALIANVRFTHRTFSGFIIGKIIDSAIIGVICFAGTSLMGTPYSVLISVIVGITNVIPFFGPYLGAIPSALLILMVDPLQCLYFIIFILVLQQVDGNIIGPKILGDSTGLSGFWVIFSITLFGGMFGILGMIVGVPVFAIFYAAVRSSVNQMLRKKKMPVKTKEYMDVGSIENGDFIPYESEKRAQLHAGSESQPRNKLLRPFNQFKTTDKNQMTAQKNNDADVPEKSEEDQR